MKLVIKIILALLVYSSLSSAATSEPFDKGKAMHFQCDTGVTVHIIDAKRAVINGDLDADIVQASEQRLQAEGRHGPDNIITHIDMNSMGMGYYSLLSMEVDDKNGTKEPWNSKFYGAKAMICLRTK